jgi:hypothetical protein
MIFKLFSISIFGLLILTQISCDSFGYTPDDIKTIQYTNNSGTQLDINYQKIEVINSLAAYNKLINSIPSMSNTAPNYNEETETLIALFAKAINCSFYPQVTDVTRFNHRYSTDFQIIVHFFSKRSSEQLIGNCKNAPQTYYYYNLIKIQKTDANITFKPRYNIF